MKKARVIAGPLSVELYVPFLLPKGEVEALAVDVSCDDTCRVCVLTPPGRAAVASIAVQGEGAVMAVGRNFRPVGGAPFHETPPGRIVYGQWAPPSGEQRESASGEGVVVCRVRSDCVEIHSHGGKAAIEAIVASLTDRGCREISWRSWSESNEGSLTAEAIAALAKARTRRVAGILLDQYRGALRRAVQAALSHLDAGELEQAKQRLDALLHIAPLGLRLARPWRIVVAGRPNVGKSSLINALLGYRRAIVHDTPGVTRDVLTAAAALDGWPVEFADTAGVRESDDELETAGVARTRLELQAADVVVLVSDAGQAWSKEDEALFSAAPNPLVVYNKFDLAGGTLDDRPPGFRTCALTGDGLTELTRALVDRIAPYPPESGAAVPFTTRQVEALCDALKELACTDAAAASKRLRGLLT